MKFRQLALFALALLLSTTGLWAQENQTSDKKEKRQIVIVKKSVDENGKEVTERIVRDLEAEGEKRLEYKGKDGEIIELKMDGEKNWHSISEDIHILNDEIKELKVIDIQDIDNMTDELQEKLKSFDIEVESLDSDRIIEIKVADEDGKNNVIRWNGDGEMPEEIRQKMKEHNIKKGHFEDNVFFQSKGKKAFLGVVSGKKVEVVKENGVETRTEDDHSDVDGAYIQEVVEGSGAEAAGLQEGDVITRIDGTTISDFSDLSKQLSNYEIGDQIDITYVRDNTTNQTKATLGEHNFDFDFNFEWKDEDGQEFEFGEGQKFFFKEDEGHKHNIVILQEADGEEGTRIRKRVVIITDGDGESEVETELELELLDEAEQPEDEIIEVPPTELEIAPNELELTDFDAYPNPTDGQIQVKFSAPAQPTTLTISDISGKEIYKDTVRNFDGFYNKEISLRGLPTGPYVIRVAQDDQVFTKQIIVQ